jgi:hypothetical protein
MGDSDAEPPRDPPRISTPLSHIRSLGRIDSSSIVSPSRPAERRLSARAASAAVISSHVPTPPQTDRYGWRSDPSSSATVTDDEKRAQFSEAVIEARREKKWIVMTARWSEFKKRHPEKVNKRVQKGIPNCVRGLAWRLILEAEPPEEPTMEALVEMGVPACMRVIEGDVPRTLPGQVMLEAVPGRGALQKVLRAYANLDQEVGYVQGMAFIAGMFLSYFDEIHAFWCFEALMRSRQHRLLYVNRFAGLEKLNKAWEVLLHMKYGKIAARMEKLDIRPITYTTAWWLTGFMALEMAPALRLRLFDRFVTFGWRALFSFGLVIVSGLKNLLATGQMLECLEALQRPGTGPALRDWRKAFKKYNKKWIEEKEYRQCFTKANVELV